MLCANQYPLINYLTFSELRRQRADEKTVEEAEQRASLYHQANLQLKTRLAKTERLLKAKEAQEKFRKSSAASTSKAATFGLGAVRSVDALVDQPLRMASAVRTFHEHPYLVSSAVFTSLTKPKIGLD